MRSSGIRTVRYRGMTGESSTTALEMFDFFADRLKVQQREAGVRHDLIDAVFALGGEDDLVRLLARVKALQAFVETEDGANLLAGYKRAANILKKEDGTAARDGDAREQGSRRPARRIRCAGRGSRPRAGVAEMAQGRLRRPMRCGEGADRRARRAEPRAAARSRPRTSPRRWPRSPRCARRSTRSSTR